MPRQALSFSAKSMKSLATTVNDGSGVGSGMRPGPRSRGRDEAGVQPEFARRQQVP